MSKSLYKKKTPPMVGAPVNKTKKKTVKKNTTTKKTKTKNPKNKNILDTKVKNIPKALVKKTKQKVKNVLNNTPKENIKKAIFGDSNIYVKIYKSMKKTYKNRK